MKDIREDLRQQGYKLIDFNINGIWITQIYVNGNSKIQVLSRVEYDGELEEQEVEVIE